MTWATLVRDLLNKIGLGNYWIAQHVQNENYFLCILKQRLTDIFLQDWLSEVARTSSSRLYKHIIRDTFQFESYLNMCNKQLRICITKIRLSSHLFLIERGRWGRARVERSERKCNVCNVVEDEFHCLFECPRYSEERKGFVPERMIKRPSMYEFIKYLQSEDERMQRKLGMLCMRVQKEYKKYV